MQSWFNLLYVENAISELDTIEEYFFDTYTLSSPRLYMWFPQNRVPAQVIISGKASAKPFFTISDSLRLTFDNLAFSISSHAAIYGKNVFGPNVRRCVFSNLGQEGVKLEASSNSVIASSAFSNVGTSALLLKGKAGLPSLVAQENSIQGVSWFGKVYSAGIQLSGSSVVVKDNYLRQGWYGGIYLTSESYNHVVDRSDVGYFVQHFHDFGNIYFFAGNLKDRNITITNKYVHDTHEVGIYIDDFASGCTVQNNLVTRTNVGIYVHGGTNNLASDNAHHNIANHVYQYIALDPLSTCSMPST
ncbi:hypothetical protein HDU96_006015 [Phlyctochytrium bullatum]|nr:hypothetical protein HDU96_006015 [Phlyctochytrium bullatum]